MTYITRPSLITNRTLFTKPLSVGFGMEFPLVWRVGVIFAVLVGLVVSIPDEVDRPKTILLYTPLAIYPKWYLDKYWTNSVVDETVRMAITN